MNEYILSDLHRYYGKHDLKTFIIAFLKDRTFRFQCAFRLCNDKGINRIIGLVMWRLNRSRHTIQLPRQTKVGYGLYIGHGGPIVVNPTTKIPHSHHMTKYAKKFFNHLTYFNIFIQIP